MLKFFKNLRSRYIYIYIITQSLSDQYSNSKIKNKKGEEIKPLNDYENAIIVLDHILSPSNGRYIDQFFIGGMHNNLDNNYLSQSYFDLPKRITRNNSNKIILSSQTWKGIKNVYRDVGGYVMRYDEIEQKCRKLWEDEYNSLCIDRSKKRKMKILYF